MRPARTAMAPRAIGVLRTRSGGAIQGRVCDPHRHTLEKIREPLSELWIDDDGEMRSHSVNARKPSSNCASELPPSASGRKASIAAAKSPRAAAVLASAIGSSLMLYGATIKRTKTF